MQDRFRVKAGDSLQQILRRPEVCIEDLGAILQDQGLPLNREEGLAVQTQIKYEGYIGQQIRDVERLSSLEARPIPININYNHVAGLSRETVERLEKIKPGSLGQASRIPGITPAAVSVLNIHLELRQKSGVFNVNVKYVFSITMSSLSVLIVIEVRSKHY